MTFVLMLKRGGTIDMQDKIKKFRGNIIVTGIVSIVLGILFLIEPVLSGYIFCYLIGAMILVAGVVKIIMCFAKREDVALSFVGGLLLFLFGLLCVFRPEIIASFLTILSGIYIAGNAASSLSAGTQCVREGNGGIGILIIIISVLLMFCGIFIIFAPFGFIMILSGVSLLVNGVFSLIFMGTLSRYLNNDNNNN